MKIRNARISDLPSIMRIYAHARQFMIEQGNPQQWSNRNWPPESLVLDDIQNEKCYVNVDDRDIPHAVFFYDYGSDIDESYVTIRDGDWTGPEPYGVVHRIASDRSEKGLGTFCLNWAYENCHNLRIDTHSDNKPMQNLLKKLGFQNCGTVLEVVNHSPRLAFEKYEKMLAL